MTLKNYLIIILILLVSAGISWLFYFYKSNSDFPRSTKKILFVLRTITLFGVGLLILNPLIKIDHRSVEKPIIAIVTDNSESIIINKDSNFYKKEYPALMNQLQESLSDNFEVATFNYAETTKDSLSFKYKGKETDASDAFQKLYNLYSGRNLGAVIFAGDGLYNKGINPTYIADKLKTNIYTIALGDTNVQKDLIALKANVNKFAYLGNEFPVEITTQANELSGKSTEMDIQHNGQSVYKKVISINSGSFLINTAIQLKADKPGMQKYTVYLRPLEGEISKTNNRLDFFIEVLDGRQKILLLAASPHPDIAAIKSVIDKNDNYQLESKLASDFNGSVEKFNLVILHQLPSQKNAASDIIAKCKKSGIPTLYILGTQSSLSGFNNLNTGLQINSRKTSLNDAQAICNEKFPLFTFSETGKKMILKLPPLKCFFGQYQVSPSSSTLFYQKIGSIETEQPLMVFNHGTDNRTGVIAGEGLWRWKLNEYAQTQSSETFTELISKTIQYLSVKADKSLFRVKSPQVVNENQPIVFDAELYNESYELINTPEVELNVYDSKNKAYKFSFSKTSNAYTLNAGILPPGDYRYDAKTKNGDKVLTSKGTFSVITLQKETAKTIANHKLLYTISKNHKGKMVYPRQILDLVKEINNREDIKPVSYIERSVKDIISLWWIVLIIVLSISGEWFLRKREGGY